MLVIVLFISTNNILQKLLVYQTKLMGDPIHPFEWSYIIGLCLVPMCLLTVKYLKADIFPIPPAMRGAFFARCIFGFLNNSCFMLSLQYISLAKTSVLFWTAPIWTALLGNLYLKERLSVYDWAAGMFAFVGILLI